MEKLCSARPIIMSKGNPHIVVITGAESTGKTALSKYLGDYFSSPWYPEYAREYLEKNGITYTRSDVEHIARVQREQMEEASRLKTPYVFFDTWLIITKVWMEVLYGECPGWIQEAITTAPVDLYLLCDTDIPWIPDPLRENGGDMRELLSSEYKRNIIGAGYQYSLVTGQGNDRLICATERISDCFREKENPLLGEQKI